MKFKAMSASYDSANARFLVKSTNKKSPVQPNTHIHPLKSVNIKTSRKLEFIERTKLGISNQAEIARNFSFSLTNFGSFMFLNNATVH